MCIELRGFYLKVRSNSKLALCSFWYCFAVAINITVIMNGVYLGHLSPAGLTLLMVSLLPRSGSS